jgi:Ni,Fe-hydrogenase maturation factor
VRTLCIAVGNPLRADDGVADRVLDLLEPIVGAAFLRAQQLVPELSEEIARAQNVIFIDADVNPGPPHIEQIVPRELRGSPLAHAMTLPRSFASPLAFLDLPERHSSAMYRESISFPAKDCRLRRKQTRIAQHR